MRLRCPVMRVEQEAAPKRHAQPTMLVRRAAGESWASTVCSVCASGYGSAAQGGPRMTRTTLGWYVSALQAARGERRAGQGAGDVSGKFGGGKPRKAVLICTALGITEASATAMFSASTLRPRSSISFSCAVLVIHTLALLAAAQHRSPNMRIGFVRSSPRFPCSQHRTPFSRTRATPMTCSRRLNRTHKVSAKTLVHRKPITFS